MIHLALVFSFAACFLTATPYWAPAMLAAALCFLAHIHSK